MDFSSQRQYIQRAEDVHINIDTANTPITVYTSPSGNDFNSQLLFLFWFANIKVNKLKLMLPTRMEQRLTIYLMVK